ncbi:uncharacterized protein LOC110114065 [Dendrobium catenatum]|uniref:Uncharacterized protein n=2 Tax=Dendrobium TaxID=37818 RepID=A0A8T3AAY0_DENNO|nr:uncharacterized protein LOC110114065 [Dendrobium catenatum]KAI0493289.1 hypothetical protein KFK09_027565 [Dendrobium nobile]PKU67019.1 hypothetical protein MA16_Dca018759 [Dendrobium catenatum]
MITRSKLVEELRKYQIGSQSKWAALLIFSPKPQIKNRKDVVVALIFALFFCFIIISSYMSLYFKCFRLAAIVICVAILLPTYLRFSRQRKLARKRDGRYSLPLSM